MNRSENACLSVEKRVPRACGDEPVRGGELRLMIECSARAEMNLRNIVGIDLASDVFGASNTASTPPCRQVPCSERHAKAGGGPAIFDNEDPAHLEKIQHLLRPAR